MAAGTDWAGDVTGEELIPTPEDEAAIRAGQRALVRSGYDVISHAYRSDDGAAHSSTDEDPGLYVEWVAELAGLIPARARVVDLGCGIGLPGTRALTEHGLSVLGVDFSAVQLARARRLVPAASFVRADMAEFHLRPASVDAVTAFYSLIHQPRIRGSSARAATCWPSWAPPTGPGPSPIWAPTCSGTTRIPAPTCAGAGRPG